LLLLFVALLAQYTMALLGTLFNVAKVGVGLLNSVINQPSLAQDYVFEHEGEEQRILGTFVAAHPDRRLVGTTVVGFSEEYATDAITFTTSQDATGYHIWANNTDPTTPYNISFTTTDSAANSQWVPMTIPAAQNPPNLPSVEITNQLSTFNGGDVVVTPISPSSAAVAVNKQLALHSKAQIKAAANTLLGNLGISTIVASASWQVYKSAQGTVTFSWSTGNDGGINGYNVQNTLPFPVDCSVNVIWGSPTTSTTVDSIIPASTSAPQNVPLPAAINRPINYVNVAVSNTNTSAQFVAEIVKEAVALQAAEGIVVKNLRIVHGSKSKSRSNFHTTHKHA